MWIGGEGGLFRYDGLSFQAIPLPDSLSKVAITALYEADGRLWIGFEGGTICYLPSNTVFLSNDPQDRKPGHPVRSPLKRWLPEEGNPAKTITAFCRDKTGGFWISTYGEGLYCWKNKRLYQFGEEDGMAGTDIYTLVQDGNGRIWAATDAGISICSMPEPGKKKVQNLSIAEGLPDEIVYTLLGDNAGNVWIGSYDHGVCRYNIRQQKLEFPLRDWVYGPVTSMALFGSRELWVGTTHSGLIRLEFQQEFQGQAQAYPLPETHALRREKIVALCKDREGLLWVLGSKGAIWSSNVRIGLQSAPVQDVQAVCVDRQNRLWAGTAQGLFLREKNQFRAVLKGQENVLSLWEAPDGNLWVGTFGNGVFVLNPAGKVVHRLTEGNGLANGSVLSIGGDSAEVWLATLGGVTEISLKDWKPKAYQDELGAGYVYKVMVDSRGRTWFGTDGAGLIVLENGKFVHYKEAAGQPLKTIYSIAEDLQGMIWFCTDQNGLFRFDGQNFRHYTPEEHLHSLVINGLVVDGNGYLILSYEDGIDVLTPKTGHVTFYDASSGAPTAEANFNALCRDGTGNVWVGTKQGILRLAAFDEPFMFDPEPNITAVSVFLQPLDFLSNVVFSHDQNYFLFNFTGLWFTNPELVRYRYRLEGFDHDWVISKEHFASYPNLPPGHYVFHLQASEHGEFEGTPEAAYAFTVQPPFWTRWWFIVSCLLAVTALLYFFVHAREKRFRREDALRRESVESQFAALKSQINPHFLFNSFNTLITIIDENPKIAVEYVEHLSDFYRSIMVYREKDLIPLQEEMGLVHNFDFLLKKRYENNFRLNDHLNGHPGFVMPLTLQMLVENAVKHNIISNAKPLIVDIYVENEGYVVIRNNNQRKLKPEPGTHFGLQSLINRYTLLGAPQVIVEETPEFFTVKVPIL